MRGKRLFITGGVVVLIPVIAIAWWLLSPFFISKTVDEEFPFSANAVVPANMTPIEVEQIMSGMSKVDQIVDQSMPEAMTSGPAADGPVRLKSGGLTDADNFHKGSGQATIYRNADGSHLLRLENLNVTNGPELHVILTPHADPTSRSDVSAPGYVDLGRLKGNMGNQNYEIPADVDVAAQGSLVIYCKPFHVIFSVAALQDAG